MDWSWSDFLGRIKLCVRKVDAETASSLLDQGVPEKFDGEGIGEYQQPRCPMCQSLRISFRGLNKAVDYTSAIMGGPRPLHRSLWECDACGHQWPRICKETAEQLPDIRIFYPYVSDGNRDTRRYVDIGDRVPPHMAIGLSGDRREVSLSLESPILLR